MSSFETNFLYNFEKTHCLDGAKNTMECGVRLEVKLQLLFVWMWKCNTAALARTETRRSFLGEAAFCCREIYYYNLPLLFTQREENRKECSV